MISNLVGPKICQIGWLQASAAEFLFPLTYICLDVFTDVHGYGASRDGRGHRRYAGLADDDPDAPSLTWSSAA